MSDLIPNPEWRDIRTAPRGARILVRVSGGPDPVPALDRVVVAFWSSRESCWRNAGDGAVTPIYPTSWPPIPTFYLDEASEPDSYTDEFFEAVLVELGFPAWYRDPSVAEAIDRAWDSGLRSVGEVAQSVLKSNLRIRRLVGG